MILASLKLSDFRGYDALSLPLTAKLTVLVGDNAQGKTNLLRAVELLGLGDAREGGGEAVRFGAARALVEGRVPGTGAGDRLLATVEHGRVRLAANGKVQPRPRWVGRLPVLFVGPEDRDQVMGPPSARRALLDELLEQSEPAYLAATREYRGALRQRNRALADPAAAVEEIEIWEEPLARAGGILLAARVNAVENLGPRASAWHRELIGPDAKPLGLAYAAGVPRPADPGAAAGWTASLREAFAAARERERAYGGTLAGPHRDEVEIALAGRALKGTGSSGEVWSAILAVALASAELLGERLGRLPLLLLDDVLTALDPGRRERLLDVLAELPQALLTTTGVPAGGGARAVYDVRAHRLARRSDAATEVTTTPWVPSDPGLSATC